MARFRILPKLPGIESQAIAIPEGKAKYSDGLVVQFFPKSRPSWTANFTPGLLVGRPDVAFECHDGNHVLVISGGDAWLIDPENPHKSVQIDNWTTEIIDVPEHKMFILGTPVSFAGLGANGVLWKSQRISWDGFRKLSIAGGYLTGESYTPMDRAKPWVGFRLDITNGHHEGGAYDKHTPQMGF